MRATLIQKEASGPFESAAKHVHGAPKIFLQKPHHHICMETSERMFCPYKTKHVYYISHYRRYLCTS